MSTKAFIAAMIAMLVVLLISMTMSELNYLGLIQ
jgi:hypothetical protein